MVHPEELRTRLLVGRRQNAIQNGLDLRGRRSFTEVSSFLHPIAKPAPRNDMWIRWPGGHRVLFDSRMQFCGQTGHSRQRSGHFGPQVGPDGTRKIGRHVSPASLLASDEQVIRHHPWMLSRYPGTFRIPRCPRSGAAEIIFSVERPGCESSVLPVLFRRKNKPGETCGPRDNALRSFGCHGELFLRVQAAKAKHRCDSQSGRLTCNGERRESAVEEMDAARLRGPVWHNDPWREWAASFC
jgi:hypothetical protein